MNVILNNTGPAKSIIPDVYYPRLQVNRLGEIVLATHKQGSLTSGILVGHTPDAVARFKLGKKFDDWEVVGELQDYNGAVTVTIVNEIQER